MSAKVLILASGFFCVGEELRHKVVQLLITTNDRRRLQDRQATRKLSKQHDQKVFQMSG